MKKEKVYKPTEKELNEFMLTLLSGEERKVRKLSITFNNDKEESLIKPFIFEAEGRDYDLILSFFKSQASSTQAIPNNNKLFLKVYNALGLSTWQTDKKFSDRYLSLDYVDKESNPSDPFIDHNFWYWSYWQTYAKIGIGSVLQLTGYDMYGTNHNTKTQVLFSKGETELVIPIVSKTDTELFKKFWNLDNIPPTVSMKIKKEV